MKVCGSFSYKAKEYSAESSASLSALDSMGKKKSENMRMWGSFPKQDLHNSKPSVDTISFLINIDGNSNRTQGIGKHGTPLECYSSICGKPTHCALIGDASQFFCLGDRFSGMNTGQLKLM